MRRKTMVLIFLMAIGSIQAQTFDFNCAPPTGGVQGSGNSSYNPDTGKLIIDGTTFSSDPINSYGGHWYAPVGWKGTVTRTEVWYVTDPNTTTRPVPHFETVGDGVRLTELDFAGLVSAANTFIPLSNKGVKYTRTEGGKVDYKGISFVKNGNRYDAPDGLRNVNRYARISLLNREDGMWKLQFQNNGECPCDLVGYTEGGVYTYNPGQVRSWDWASFEEAADHLTRYNAGTFIPDDIWFTDRNGPSVGYNRLVNWDAGDQSGFTAAGITINGNVIPGNIRFTKRANGQWKVEIKRNINSSPWKTYNIESHPESGELKGDIIWIANDFNEAYTNIVGVDYYDEATDVFVYDGEVWESDVNRVYTPPSTQVFSKEISVTRLSDDGWILQIDNFRTPLDSFADLVESLDVNRN